MSAGAQFPAPYSVPMSPLGLLVARSVVDALSRHEIDAVD
jgi:hypothetical protein